MDEMRYQVMNLDQLNTPCLVYFRDIIEENIRAMVSVAKDPSRLWPHVKTHKMEDIVKLQIQYGITKFKAATIGEAQMAAKAGAEDVLVAYPLVGPMIRRFFQLTQSYSLTRFWAVGDNIEQIRFLGQQFMKSGSKARLFVDVNAGTDRTGVALPDLFRFYQDAAGIPGIEVHGFHCYDGNLGITDYEKRKQAAEELDMKLAQIAFSLKSRGYGCRILLMGGTPTFPCHAPHTELLLSPGTCIISDYGYLTRYPDEPFIPAGLVLSRVISCSKKGYFTLDLGYKAIASDAPERQRGFLLGVPYAVPVMQNEEHWVWKMKPGYETMRPPIGTLLFIIPNHICPTTALYQEAFVVQDRRIVSRWPVSARDRMITI